jgi:hypothetical protein
MTGKGSGTREQAVIVILHVSHSHTLLGLPRIIQHTGRVCVLIRAPGQTESVQLCESVVSRATSLMAKLRDCSLPLIEPARSPWRLRGSEPQFASKQNQIICDIDVVEAFRETG